MKIEWTGDLEDDCCARAGNIHAHCELLGEIKLTCDDGDPPHSSEYWYCSVAPVDENLRATGPDLFHSGESAGWILGGEMARAICEAIMRAYFANPYGDLPAPHPKPSLSAKRDL